MNLDAGRSIGSRTIGKNIRRNLFARIVLFASLLALPGIIALIPCAPAFGMVRTLPLPDQDGEASRALDEARQAYDASQYAHAVELLKNFAATHSQSSESALWMLKSYYEMWQMDAAIASGEQAAELQPSSSEIHMWLGRAYGRKAERAAFLSAMSLAKKARREFETAVHLDAANFEAQQDLVEYYCSAPGIMGGGEEKAQKQIAAIAALDAAEAHFARAECWSDQKEWARADAEFQVALRANQKRPFVFFEIADYFTTRRHPDRILEASGGGAKLSPGDPRADFYRGVALVMKNEELGDAESFLNSYLNKAPKRMDYPSYSAAHEWLGHLHEHQGNARKAAKEYQAALDADPRNKTAREALRRLAH